MAEPSVEQGAAASQGRVPFSTRALLGTGLAAEGTQNVAFNTFVLFFYNQVLGLSGTWTGAALFLALCIDAVMDPLVGSLSDGWRSRFGRRSSLMAVVSALAAAAPGCPDARIGFFLRTVRIPVPGDSFPRVPDDAGIAGRALRRSGPAAEL